MTDTTTLQSLGLSLTLAVFLAAWFITQALEDIATAIKERR